MTEMNGCEVRVVYEDNAEDDTLPTVMPPYEELLRQADEAYKRGDGDLALDFLMMAQRVRSCQKYRVQRTIDRAKGLLPLVALYVAMLGWSIYCINHWVLR